MIRSAKGLVNVFNSGCLSGRLCKADVYYPLHVFALCQRKQHWWKISETRWNKEILVWKSESKTQNWNWNKIWLKPRLKQMQKKGTLYSWCMMVRFWYWSKRFSDPRYFMNQFPPLQKWEKVNSAFVGSFGPSPGLLLSDACWATGLLIILFERTCYMTNMFCACRFLFHNLDLKSQREFVTTVLTWHPLWQSQDHFRWYK